MDALVTVQKTVALVGLQIGSWFKFSMEFIQDLLVKWKPTLQRVQVTSLKILDAASVQAYHLMVRMKAFNKRMYQRIGFRLQSPTRLRLAEHENVAHASDNMLGNNATSSHVEGAAANNTAGQGNIALNWIQKLWNRSRKQTRNTTSSSSTSEL